ncbi:NAD-dependent epimerase/dehydratase family protein, partial [Candidatus Peregrinibacteria bacterium]|nr:NAD-dependent epimerase/dehydratase family protein [Candidatus Peregrinibacteria bacterium]
MHLLVTGGAGFVGSRIAIALEHEGHDVTIVDRTPHAGNLQEFRGKILEADISIPEYFDSFVEKVDCVFHQAACTDTTVTDETFMRRQNVDAFLALLRWAERSGADVIYASSAAVYGTAPSPQQVGVAECPLNAYGRSKLMTDEEVRRRIAASPIKIIGLRYFNVYGPGEAHKKHMASMIHRLAAQMHAGERPRIFTDGEQRRDQIYVDDVVQANLLA